MADESGKGRISPVDEVKLLRAAACDWRLSRGDMGVFAVILRHADPEWLAFPGTRLIAEQARLAASNVVSSIEKLERYRYLKVIRRGQRKRQDYQVLESPKVVRSAPARKSSGFGRSAPADKSSDEKSSAPVDMHSTAPVDRKDLLLSIGTEGSLEDTFEGSCAARAVLPEEEQREPEPHQWLKNTWRQALATDDQRLIRTLRSEYGKPLNELIESGELQEAGSHA